MLGKGSRGSGGKLSLDDLAKITEDVHDAVDKWHNIGIQLGLHESELQSIESNYPRQNDRLREMIYKWLQNKVATWGKMVSARSYFDIASVEKSALAICCVFMHLKDTAALVLNPILTIAT